MTSDRPTTTPVREADEIVDRLFVGRDLITLRELANEVRVVSYRSLREKASRREFTHIEVGNKRWLTRTQAAAVVALLLADNTVPAETPDDGLNDVRSRVARQRATAAVAPPQRRQSRPAA